MSRMFGAVYEARFTRVHVDEMIAMLRYFPKKKQKLKRHLHAFFVLLNFNKLKKLCINVSPQS